MPLTHARVFWVALLVGCGGSTTTPEGPGADARRGLQVFGGAGFETMRLDGPEGVVANGHLFTGPAGLPRIALRQGVLLPESARVITFTPVTGAIDGAMGFLDGRVLYATHGRLVEIHRGAVVAERVVDAEGQRVQMRAATPNSAYVWLGRRLTLLAANGDVHPLIDLPEPITAVGGNGNLTFAATSDGTLWSLRMNRRVRRVLRHREPFRAVAIDPSGYVLAADRAAVYLIAEGIAYPLAVGLRDAQLSPGRTHTYIFEPSRARLSRFRDLIAVEQRLGL